MADDPSDEVFCAYRDLWEKVRSLKKLMPVFLKVVSAVKRILYHPKRASSLVECYNSILRPIQQVKKQVTQEFLWLKALHHNMKSFKQGRRKGKSPFQIPGIDLGKQDWIQLLEAYQLAAQGDVFQVYLKHRGGVCPFQTVMLSQESEPDKLGYPQKPLTRPYNFHSIRYPFHIWDTVVKSG